MTLKTRLNRVEEAVNIYMEKPYIILDGSFSGLKVASPPPNRKVLSDDEAIAMGLMPEPEIDANP